MGIAWQYIIAQRLIMAWRMWRNQHQHRHGESINSGIMAKAAYGSMAQYQA